MKKIKYLIFILFILSHCSIDTKSGLWQDKNYVKQEKKLSKLKFNKELTFNEFKQNVILYGKKSKYPNLTEN